MDPRKAQLIQTIRDRRAQLDHTLEHLDARVTEIARIPERVRARVRLVGRWTAVVVGVTTLTLASLLLVRALVRSEVRGARRRRA